MKRIRIIEDDAVIRSELTTLDQWGRSFWLT